MIDTHELENCSLLRTGLNKCFPVPIRPIVFVLVPTQFLLCKSHGLIGRV